MTWIAIALIVFVALFVRERMHSSRLQKQNRELIERVAQLENTSPPSDGEDQDAIDSRELQQLRERVQVLERIATDDNSSEARKAQRIAREIESLRGDIARRSSTSTTSRSTGEMSE